MANPEKLDLSGLRDPMAQTVLPNLLRVGLVPERLVPGYLAQGWRVDRDAATVEDLHTFGEETKAIRAVFKEQGVDFSDPKQVSQATL